MMYYHELSEYRVIGHRRDGWAVVVTVGIHRGTNTFEVLAPCPHCGNNVVREHDAEAWRREQEARGDGSAQ